MTSWATRRALRLSRGQLLHSTEDTATAIGACCAVLADCWFFLKRQGRTWLFCDRREDNALHRAAQGSLDRRGSGGSVLAKKETETACPHIPGGGSRKSLSHKDNGGQRWHVSQKPPHTGTVSLTHPALDRKDDVSIQASAYDRHLVCITPVTPSMGLRKSLWEPAGGQQRHSA